MTCRSCAVVACGAYSGVKGVHVKTMDCGYKWKKTTDEKGYVHVDYDNSGKFFDYCLKTTDNKCWFKANKKEHTYYPDNHKVRLIRNV